jgi:hypothetical protein
VALKTNNHKFTPVQGIWQTSLFCERTGHVLVNITPTARLTPSRRVISRIAAKTGLSVSTVERISAGHLKEIRGEYIDALSTYFAELLGMDVSEIMLVAAERVPLPSQLNIRPDRRGVRVGERTRGKPSNE